MTAEPLHHVPLAEWPPAEQLEELTTIGIGGTLGDAVDQVAEHIDAIATLLADDALADQVRHRLIQRIAHRLASTDS